MLQIWWSVTALDYTDVILIIALSTPGLYYSRSKEELDPHIKLFTPRSVFFAIGLSLVELK